MRNVAMLVVALSVTQFAYAQTPTRAQMQARIERLRAELNAKEARFLDPSPTDKREYPDLLNQSDRGLVRLLPREVFDKPEKLTVRGGGAYYSFSRLTHEYGHGSDIELANGEFSVGFAGADYGYIARIQNQPVLSVTLDSPGVGVLATHEAPSVEPGAREQQRQSSTGFTVENIRYANRVSADVGATYILRSADYGGSDVLVCLQTLRKDDDGSMVFAWHLLKRYPKPELLRADQAPPSTGGLSNSRGDRSARPNIDVILNDTRALGHANVGGAGENSDDSEAGHRLRESQRGRARIRARPGS